MFLEQARSGVGVLKGFGHEWDEAAQVFGKTAVYLKGNLVGMYTNLTDGPAKAGREPPPVDEVMATFLVLSEQLATLQLIPWMPGPAHALFGLSRKALPPGTLDEYEEKVCDYYVEASWDASFDAFRTAVLDFNPTLVPLFRYSAHKQEQAIYSLSGGDLEHFDQWSLDWKGKSRQYLKTYQGTLAVHPDVQPRAGEAEGEVLRLEKEWSEALHEVWLAPKPQDPLAEKVRQVIGVD